MRGRAIDPGDAARYHAAGWWGNLTLSDLVSLHARTRGPAAAFVTLRPGFDVVPEDLVEHCRPSLARYKVPREVYIEESLPKNAVGKVAKPVLRQQLARRPMT